MEKRHTTQVENVMREQRLKQWIFQWERAHISVELLGKVWETDEEGRRSSRWRTTARAKMPSSMSKAGAVSVKMT